MKAMILAGGFGTRLAEETEVRPKPMVEIGGRPMIWHIMQHYSKHGIKNFIVCLGYKAEYIKKFFLEYSISLSDFTVALEKNEVTVHKKKAEDWNVTLVDTGINTMTGGRIKKAIEFLEINDTFCLTYGDGLSNVDITGSIGFHKSRKKLATVTAVTPPGRFGVLDVSDQDMITGFREKIASDQYRINGGYFVLEPGVANYIDNDSTVWEQEPLQRLAHENQLNAWKHDGFWQPMDTLRDKLHLQTLWDKGSPPWRI